jgi:S1-C subfamily serine protease
MKPMTFASGLLALAFAAAPALAQQQPGVLTAEQLFERVAPSVWMVETFDAQNRPMATGSGVVVAPGRVITNCHVLARSKRVVVSRENVSYGASLEHPDPERDLCQLKVANFTAPAVQITGLDGIKIGSRVYAVGNPRGFEQTISDGLLSGIRRTESGDFTALQITVPISKGSSGGGLFDARGRLVGITTFTVRDAQNVNFALPASWIDELPQRAQAALQKGNEARTPAVAAAAAATATGTARVYEYRLRDRVTGIVRPVTYRLDRMDGDKLMFNQGTRVEGKDGQVLTLTAAIGGEFDQAMPPGGWITKEPAPGAVWSLRYETLLGGNRVGMELRAQAAGESTMRFKDGDLRILRVDFKGHTQRGTANTNPSGAYRATAWYAPELGRIVRFEARSRGGVGSGVFLIDEVLELADVRAE